jgi:hypothetical protein
MRVFVRENSDNVNFIAVVPEIQFFFCATFFLCPIGMAIRLINLFAHIGGGYGNFLPKMMALNVSGSDSSNIMVQWRYSTVEL